jgi:hypothetical protein
MPEINSFMQARGFIVGGIRCSNLKDSLKISAHATMKKTYQEASA